MCACVYMYAHTANVHAYACVHVCVPMHMYVWCVCSCVRVCVYCVSVHACACVHVCVCTTCVCMSMHLCTGVRAVREAVRVRVHIDGGDKESGSWLAGSCLCLVPSE